MFGKKKENQGASVQEATPKEASKAQQKNDIITAIIMILTGAIAAGTFIMAGFSVVSFFSSSSGADNDSYIYVTGKNYTDSEKLYSSYGDKNKNKANDIALIGNKLFISESRITPSLFSSENTSSIVGEGNTDFALSQIGGTVYDHVLSSDFANGKYFIDLSEIKQGDYLIMPVSTTSGSTKDYNPYSMNSGESIDYTSYTLPDENGERRRISIKDNSSSPFTVINVTECGNILPDNYYDAVCFASEYQMSDAGALSKDDTYINEETISSLSSSLKGERKYRIKTVIGTDRIKEAYAVKATCSFAISNKYDKDYTSSYIYKGYEGINTSVLTNGELKGYDLIPEIRELTGNMDNAGKAYAGVIGNNLLTPEDTIHGKEAFLIHYDEDGNYLNRIAQYLA